MPSCIRTSSCLGPGLPAPVLTVFSPQPPEGTCEHPSQSRLCSVTQGFLPLGRASAHLT